MSTPKKQTKASRLAAKKEAEQAAAAAALIAQAQLKRRRTVTAVAITFCVLIFVGGFAWALYSKKVQDRTATPKGVEQTAYVVGSGPTELTVYEDFSCHACRDAETTMGATLHKLAAAGKLTLNYKIMAFLGPESLRAANAAACAADGDQFVAYHDALYSNRLQPYTFDEPALLLTGEQLGLDSKFAQCVADGTYGKL